MYNCNQLCSCEAVFDASQLTQMFLLSPDEIIGKVLSFVKTKDAPYTAIYTGLKPSRVRFHVFWMLNMYSYKCWNLRNAMDVWLEVIEGITICVTLQMISETSVSNQQVGRSLLQTVAPDVKAPIMFNESGSPCIMLWAQSLSVSLSSTSEWIDLAAQTPTLTGSMCNSSNSL